MKALTFSTYCAFLDFGNILQLFVILFCIFGGVFSRLFFFWEMISTWDIPLFWNQQQVTYFWIQHVSKMQN